MSLASWKREFYTPVNKVKKSDAAAASLRKWEGLRPENMKQHGLEWFGHRIRQTNQPSSSVAIDDSNCALCWYFLGPWSEPFPCDACPLSIVRGGVACDDKMVDEEKAPYHCGTRDQDPRPMIRWLKKAVAYQERQTKTKARRHATP